MTDDPSTPPADDIDDLLQVQGGGATLLHGNQVGTVPAPRVIERIDPADLERAMNAAMAQPYRVTLAPEPPVVTRSRSTFHARDDTGPLTRDAYTARLRRRLATDDDPLGRAVPADRRALLGAVEADVTVALLRELAAGLTVVAAGGLVGQEPMAVLALDLAERIETRNAE